MPQASRLQLYSKFPLCQILAGTGIGLHSISACISVRLCQNQAMKKPKKQRPAERIMRAHSVMQDIIAATNKPIKAPGVKKQK
jgi:hypothetical protein